MHRRLSFTLITKTQLFWPFSLAEVYVQKEEMQHFIELAKIDTEIRQAAGVFKQMPKRIKRLTSQITTNWQGVYLIYLVNCLST